MRSRSRDLVDRIAVVDENHAVGELAFQMRDVAQGLLPPVQPVGEGKVDRRPVQSHGVAEEVVAGLGDDRRIGRRFGHLGLGIHPDDAGAGLDERQRVALVHPDLMARAAAARGSAEQPVVGGDRLRAAEATASETTTERHRRVVESRRRRGDLVDRRAELQRSHRLDVEAVELGRRATEELVQIGWGPVVEDMTQ